MALLIDTSVLVDAERREEQYEQVLPGDEQDQEHSISAITVSELLHGVHRAVEEHRRALRRAVVEGMLARLEPIPITIEVARIHAETWAGLEAAGEVIGVHDLWIAATALAHGLRIATTNAREFERVPGLSVLSL
ncbi:MAG TPA: PIN domain-containing protein [Solirubrobacteraceae bacterium]|jgi:tRNA(fMet)-specific endonuclease VapC